VSGNFFGRLRNLTSVSRRRRHEAEASGPKIFKTHDAAPETGIYRVVHVAHRLPHEVVILKDERFPRCGKCKDAVIFELVHAAPDLFKHLRPRVSELAILDEEEAAGS